MSKQSKLTVAIIGAGVAGLTTAEYLLESGIECDLKIFVKERQNELPLTSGNAYALWVPYRDDKDPRIEGWADYSLRIFTALSSIYEAGITLHPYYNLRPNMFEQPWFAQKYSGFRHAVPGEISRQYADAWVMDSIPVIDPPCYLNWLKSSVEERGAVFIERNIGSFDDLTEFDVVINCAGIGARDLCGDNSFSPLRLQVVIIRNKGFNKVVVDDVGPNAMVCVAPHREYIKVGAIVDTIEDSMYPDTPGACEILERCSAAIPDFQASMRDILDVVRAPRPERARPRVETQQLSSGQLLIHNYGHGSTGFITSHGIARDICANVEDYLASSIS